MNTTQQRLDEQSLNIQHDHKNGASISFLMRKYKFSRPTLLKFLDNQKKETNV